MKPTNNIKFKCLCAMCFSFFLYVFAHSCQNALVCMSLLFCHWCLITRRFLFHSMFICHQCVPLIPCTCQPAKRRCTCQPAAHSHARRTQSMTLMCSFAGSWLLKAAIKKYQSVHGSNINSRLWFPFLQCWWRVHRLYAGRVRAAQRKRVRVVACARQAQKLLQGRKYTVHTRKGSGVSLRWFHILYCLDFFNSNFMAHFLIIKVFVGNFCNWKLKKSKERVCVVLKSPNKELSQRSFENLILSFQVDIMYFPFDDQQCILRYSFQMLRKVLEDKCLHFLLESCKHLLVADLVRGFIPGSGWILSLPWIPSTFQIT